MNCFHILVSVLFHCSQTDDFSSFSVEYIPILYFSNKSLIIEFLPFINPQILCFSTLFKQSFNSSVTVSPFYPLTVQSGQSYLLNTSKTMRRYLYPLLHLLNCCISTKSQHYISSIYDLQFHAVENVTFY